MTKQEKKNFESLLKHWRGLARAGRRLANKWKRDGYVPAYRTASAMSDVTTVHVKDVEKLLRRAK